MSFRTVDTKPPFIDIKKLISMSGEITPPDFYKEGFTNTGLDNRVFIATDSSVILTKDAIYCRDDKKE